MLITFKGQTVSFDSPPEIGTEIERNGLRYRCIGQRPHIGRNGPTTVLMWKGRCSDCGKPFEVTSGMTGIKAFNVRCKEHTKVGVPATRAAARAMKNNYRRRRQS